MENKAFDKIDLTTPEGKAQFEAIRKPQIESPLEERTNKRARPKEVKLYSRDVSKAFTEDLFFGEKKNGYQGPESQLQISIATWLKAQHPEILFHHSPNESDGNFGYNGKNKAMGTKSGWPDMEIMQANDSYHGLFIELKVRYSKPKDKQIAHMLRLNARGYKAIWCNTYDDTVKAIELYLKNKL